MSTETIPAQDNLTAVDFSFSAQLPGLLDQHGLSIILSTYQAGKVLAIGTHANQLQIRFHHFEQAMGLARTPTGIAVGSRRQVWHLQAVPGMAASIAPAGTYDLALLTRSSHYTGPVMGHELAWAGQQLWQVNTVFSCLTTLDPNHNFTPRWRPPFITEMALGDRCHLNGFAVDGTEPRYATVLGMTNIPNGWRENKAKGGALLEVPSGRIVVSGLCMPHSPRIHNGALYLLNSGLGELCQVDPGSGTLTTIARLNGYTRGMDTFGHLAVVGLSRIRETNVFGGLPIAERRGELQSGFAIVDLPTGQVLASLAFKSGVEEVFDVKFLPGFRNPILSGPLPDVDGTETLWLVPTNSDAR
jgi:uncharacterized protein (TIGR03032 family)